MIKYSMPSGHLSAVNGWGGAAEMGTRKNDWGDEWPRPERAAHWQ